MSVPVSPETFQQVEKEVHRVLGCAGSGYKEVYGDSFGAIESELFRIKDSLQKLASQRIDAPKHKVHVLHQLEFVLLEVREFSAQYADKRYHPPFVFQEVFKSQSKAIIQKLQAIASYFDTVAQQPSCTLAKVDFPQRSENRPRQQSKDSQLESIRSFLRPALSQSNCPIVEKAMDGSWLEIDKMMENEPLKVDSRTPCFTLLHLAVVWQSSFAVAMLLGRGADIQCTTQGSYNQIPDGCTPLDIAVILGNCLLVRQLVASGGSLGKLTDVSNVPMSALCRSLLSNHANFLKGVRLVRNLRYNDDTFDQLFSLLVTGHLPPNAHIASGDPNFLVHYLAEAGDCELYRLALEAGACALLRTSGNSPRYASTIAKAKGNHDLMQVALDAERAQREALAVSLPSSIPANDNSCGSSSIPKSPRLRKQLQQVSARVKQLSPLQTKSSSRDLSSPRNTDFTTSVGSSPSTTPRQSPSFRKTASQLWDRVSTK